MWDENNDAVRLSPHPTADPVWFVTEVTGSGHAKLLKSIENMYKTPQYISLKGPFY